MSVTYSNELQKAISVLNGLKQNLKQVDNKELDKSFIAQFESDIRQASKLNQENTALKAEVKQKTAEANSKLRDVKSQLKKAKYIIKTGFPKEEWKRFGVNDSR